MTDGLSKPPWVLLIVGGLEAAISLVLIFSEAQSAHFIGYAMGTFGVILAVALFRRLDSGRSSSPIYSPIRYLGHVAAAILILGVVCGSVNVYYFVQHFSLG